MKSVVNKTAVIISLVFIIIGLLGIIIWGDSNTIINISCSIIASGITLLISTYTIERKKQYSVWEEWKLARIFKTRAEKNADSDPKLKHGVTVLDAVAFGLSSFRSFHTHDMQTCLNQGMNVRLLVMNPKSEFISQQEKEEGDAAGNIAKSINDLVEWAKALNQHSTNGKITIKGYQSMTLDFYWRIDDELYIGPYMKGKKSQQTITYKYKKGGEGFELYSSYFEELWNASDNMVLVDHDNKKE